VEIHKVCSLRTKTGSGLPRSNSTYEFRPSAFYPAAFYPGLLIPAIPESQNKQREIHMKRIGVIGAVLEKPRQSQAAFNEVVAAFRGSVKGRMGIPFEHEEIAVISLTVMGELDDINTLSGKLGNLPDVTVKIAVSNALKNKGGE
jgi:putative iron-only hydrogenase system regulator